MHTTLLKKALRDIRGHLGAYLACAMLMAIGVLFYASMTQAAANLPLARDAFYSDYRFGDAFATLRSMPAARVARLSSMEGVQKASGRLTSNAHVLGEDSDNNVRLKLISYDPSETDRLNDVLVVAGQAPSAGAYELLLTEGFFKANGLYPGETLTLALRGRKIAFAVAGAVQTPEYVYLTPEGSIMPDDKNYGVAYVPLDVLEALLNRGGQVNDISFLFQPGYTYDMLERPIKEALEPGGLTQLLPRKDQPSETMLDSELASIKAMVEVVPLIFLMLGALIMSVVIKRMVEQQHAQIGLMKAYGYALQDVLLHYAMYGAVIGLMASILGGVLGAMTAEYIAELYRQYFVMPGISGAFSIGSVLKLSGLALLFGIGASMYGAKGVLHLSAADSMRPPAPPSGKPILLERIRWFWAALRTTPQMSLRNLFRARSRSILTWVGLLICYALTTAVFAFSSVTDYFMGENFRAVQQYDYKIGLTQMAEARSLQRSLSHMQGVEAAEPLLELACNLRAGGRSEAAVLLALPEDCKLYRLFDKDKTPLAPPMGGIALTYRMAEKLGVTAGDTLLLDIPYPDVEAKAVVSFLCEQYTSNYAVTTLPYIASLMHTRQLASGAMLRTQPVGQYGGQAAVGRMVQRLNEADNVASVMDSQQLLTTMNDMMESSMGMLYVMAAMAIFAGFAIVYNAGVVILSERIRELASMRVLGFTLFETVTVVALEQLLLVLAGILFGLPLTGVVMEGLGASISTDAFAMPTDVPLSAYIISGLCMLGAWVAAILVTARKVRNTSMSDVLKGRD